MYVCMYVCMYIYIYIIRDRTAAQRNGVAPVAERGHAKAPSASRAFVVAVCPVDICTYFHVNMYIYVHTFM
jgi:hypothetical protein